jgi:hypothetical protein
LILERTLPTDRYLLDATQRDRSVPHELANLCAWMRVSLDYLSRHDPSGDGSSALVAPTPHALGGVATSQRGWRFRFATEPYFITCFTPAYDARHPRHAAGTRSYILVQPDYSFGQTHVIGRDHPRLPLDAPPTPREAVRRAFDAAAKSYFVPNSVLFPQVRGVARVCCCLRVNACLFSHSPSVSVVCFQSWLYVPHEKHSLADKGWFYEWWEIDVKARSFDGDRNPLP